VAGWQAQAAQLGHLHIQQHGIDAAPFKNAQRGRAVLRLGDDVYLSDILRPG